MISTSQELSEPVTKTASPAESTAEPRKAKKASGAFRTISEVAKELDVQQHVLRFWETRFSQVRPLKRGGGRRYYRPEDVVLLKKIHNLLYTEGYTIKGVQKLLKGQSKSQILMEKAQAKAQKPESMAVVSPANTSVSPATKGRLTDYQKILLEGMLSELKDMRDMLG